MSTEITHKRQFRTGWVFWSLIGAVLFGYLLHGYMWGDVVPVTPCPAVNCTELPPEVDR